MNSEEFRISRAPKTGEVTSLLRKLRQLYFDLRLWRSVNTRRLA
ncbi:hypothetical protein DP49_5706 [Burkholderia pseudomallei]|nr:hypothetical protein DP49_5706 [Burkholderia pseudomallei]